jgi:hypothetical protein
MVVAVILLTLGMASCGPTHPLPDGGTEEQRCSPALPCPAGSFCEAGMCKPAEPLTITSTALADAVAGQPYSALLEHTGGVAPYRWSIEARDAPLAWVTVDPTSGRLGGVPTKAASPGAIQLGLTDGSGQKATRSYTLTTRACEEGASVTCTGPLGEGCGIGTARCTNGAVGTCEALRPSDDPMRCGADCQACSGSKANRCADGSCRCGDTAACAPGTLCCTGPDGSARCVDGSEDPNNCGACGRVCAAGQNARGVCIAGECSTICSEGFADCDFDGRCETDLNDPRSCGQCGRRCGVDVPGTDACISQQCVCGDTGAACPSGKSCCGADATQGLPARCVDLSTGEPSGNNINDCGACGAACNAPNNNAVATCTDATPRCGFVCREDATARYATCSDGVVCGTNLYRDVKNCDTCGNNCNEFGVIPADRGTRTCRLTASGKAECVTECKTSAGFVLVGTSPYDKRATCVPMFEKGSCGAPPQEGASPVACSDYKASGQTTVNECCAEGGGDPYQCATTCEHGDLSRAGKCTCVYDCPTNHGNCNGLMSDGCEPLTSDAHCGACGNACIPERHPQFLNAATLKCATNSFLNHSACTLGTCLHGWGTCDGDSSNGCETNLTNNRSHCGACGNSCDNATRPPNVARLDCASSSCSVIAACNTGWGDCDGAFANGCEASLKSDDLNCGACGNECTEGFVCKSGKCTLCLDC